MKTIKYISLYVLCSFACNAYAMQQSLIQDEEDKDKCTHSVGFQEPTTKVQDLICKNQIDAVRTKTVLKYIKEMQTDKDPVAYIRPAIIAAKACGWDIPLLQVAIEMNDTKIVKDLIAAKAPIVKDCSKHHPLDTALLSRSKEMINTILQDSRPNANEWDPRTLKECDLATLLHFSTQYRTPFRTEKALELSYAVLTQCSSDHIEEFAKKGFLYVPTAREFHNRYKMPSATTKHLKHCNEIFVQLPSKILEFYASPHKDLPPEAYENAKRCELIPHICLSLAPAKSPSQTIAYILQQHPITFTKEDEELTWNLCAAALAQEDAELNDNIIKTLQTQQLPLPNADFLYQVLTYLIYRQKRQSLSSYLKYKPNLNHVLSPQPQYKPWIISEESDLYKRVIPPAPLIAAIYNGSLFMISWLKRNGLAVSNAEWLEHIIESAQRTTITEEDRKYFDPKIDCFTQESEIVLEKLQRTYALLNTNPNLSLTEEAADLLCTTAQKIKQSYPDPKILERCNYIERRAWEQTSPHLYVTWKKALATGKWVTSFIPHWLGGGPSQNTDRTNIV